MPLRLNNSEDGYFTNVYLLNTNTAVWEEVRNLIAAGGGGGGGGSGIVTSANLPLSINNGVLSIDLSNYSTTNQINILLTSYVLASTYNSGLAGKIDTTHEANKIGTADATHLYDFKTQTLTLQNGSGVTAQLSVDLSGNINIGADGIVTIPYLSSWSPNQLRISDSNNVSRLLTATTGGDIQWNGSNLIDLVHLSSNYTSTSVLNGLLAAKQNSLTFSTGLQLSGSTLSTYGLRWNTNSTPSITIDDLRFEGFTVAESLNQTTNRNELTITAPSGSSVTAGLNLYYTPNSTTLNGPRLVYQTTGLNLSVPTNNIGQVRFLDFDVTEGVNGGYYEMTVANPLQGVSMQNGGVRIANTGNTNNTYAVLEVQNTGSQWPSISFLSSAGAQEGRFFVEGSGASSNMRFLGGGQYMTFQNSSNTLLMNAGSLNWNGSFSATSKSFVIDHPNPNKIPDENKIWKLKHHNIESDKPYLFYRTRIDMTSTTQTFEMPESWYPYVSTDSYVHVSPYRHFGAAWGDVGENGHTFTIHSNQVGEFNIIITALRNDECGQMCLNEPIEFQEDI